jgi:hypothetical protein
VQLRDPESGCQIGSVEGLIKEGDSDDAQSGDRVGGGVENVLPPQVRIGGC